MKNDAEEQCETESHCSFFTEFLTVRHKEIEKGSDVFQFGPPATDIGRASKL